MNSGQFAVCLSGGQVVAKLRFFPQLLSACVFGQRVPSECLLNWRALQGSLAWPLPSWYLLLVCCRFDYFHVRKDFRSVSAGCWARLKGFSVSVLAEHLSIRIFTLYFVSFSGEVNHSKLMDLSLSECSTVKDWGRILAVHSRGQCFIWINPK